MPKGRVLVCREWRLSDGLSARCLSVAAAVIRGSEYTPGVPERLIRSAYRQIEGGDRRRCQQPPGLLPAPAIRLLPVNTIPRLCRRLVKGWTGYGPGSGDR